MQPQRRGWLGVVTSIQPQGYCFIDALTKSLLLGCHENEGFGLMLPERDGSRDETKTNGMVQPEQYCFLDVAVTRILAQCSYNEIAASMYHQRAY